MQSRVSRRLPPFRMDPMKKLFDLLSSLKLAVILLVLLLIGLSIGTIVESRAGVETAGAMVYYSWWFLGLQGLFATNVGLSIASLFPWGKRRLGFLLLHASLLVIFAGSAMTYFMKIEGSLPLWEGESGSTITEHGPEGVVVSTHELPFTVTLQDFVLETYPGLMRPAGFMSIVKIADKDTSEVHDERVWMNHELHHAGYALFQSSYQRDQGREATVLSVSKDPGQGIVFIGYYGSVLGMLVVLFTRIGQTRKRAALEARHTTTAAAAVLALICGLGAGEARAESFAETMRHLPVQSDGRTMPLDTLAREAVWSITGQYSLSDQDPVDTVLAWMNDPKTTASAGVIKVGSSTLVADLGLPPYMTHTSFNVLASNPRFGQLMQMAEEADAKDMPPSNLVKEAQKLEERAMKLQGFLERESVRPLPIDGNPKAKWNVPSLFTPESLAALMSGPRLAGWPSADQIDLEIRYNQLNPTRLAWLILLASMLVSIIAGAKSIKALDAVAFVLLLCGFGLMSYGIALRWQAGDRIPAANMYESMLFLAWGVGLFAVLAYAILRNRVVVLNAAVMAALTMALTDLLPIDRFIHPIAPVLAGTAWLAIHVPIIMVGYAVLALGLVVAHMQIGFTIFAPRKVDTIDRLYDLLYWYMFVGSILLLAGILTGSMWAAQSWGRYWGWDPKEVWSLVAFLCYMAILHAKVDKMIGQFMVAAISVAAFQTIIMTYLGVNFVLTTGMHSYGQGDSPVVTWMLIVAAVEMAFLAWGYAAFRKNREILEGGRA